MSNTASSPTPDASSTVKGKLQLAGSLGGTASSPTVVTNANLTGDVTSSGNATTIGAGKVLNSMLDTTAGEVGGAWKAWTPTWTNFTIGNGTNDWKYVKVGKTIIFRGVTVMGSTSSMGSLPTFTLPVTSVTVPDTLMPICEGLLVSAGGNYNGFGTWNSTTTVLLRRWDANNNLGNITATLPVTWTTGDKIILYGQYEIP